MNKRSSAISPKLRLFFPIFLAVIVPVVLISLYSINRSKKLNEAAIQQNMELQVQTIKKMFDREHDLKLSKVKNDLKLVHDKFYEKYLSSGIEKRQIEAVNQISGDTHRIWIDDWQWGGTSLVTQEHFIDDIHALVGGTTTIFQKMDSGYVRILTNVTNAEGKVAFGTFIPNSSKVVQCIEKGEKYFGRAYVVDEWYITAYEPLYLKGELVGMLYAGDKEKDLSELRSKLSDVKIGKSGYLLVMDEGGEVVISSSTKQNKKLEQFIHTETRHISNGRFYVPDNIAGGKTLLAFDYFDDFKVYIAAVVSVKEESREIVSGLIRNALIIAILIILVFSVFVYFINAENVSRFSENLERSRRKLGDVEQALKTSRQDFQTLFNSSSDDIIVSDYKGSILEVNNSVLKTFRLGKDDLIGINIRDLLSEKSRDYIGENLNKVLNFGKHTFEAEYQIQEDKILYVEMKSRVIEYQSKHLILTHVRDISERKEIEEQMVSTIIQTEENERKRFSADLHDDLGPILSTIKLYAGLVRKNEQKKISNDDTVETIEELIDNAIQTTRNISRNIRPSILQDFGLAAAIREFVKYIKETKSINIHLTTENYKIEKRGIEETILYHTAKELINNTLRYANASNIKLDLKSFEDQIILYYRDDGMGFDLELMKKVPKGLGLNNIVNKIKSIKGTVDLHSEEGKGMFLIASVKIDSNR
jgi:PAS domain S-box-containing protein